MATPLKLVSINIEGDTHIQRVLPFLKQENADVVCLQEVLDKDIEMFKKELNMHGEYLPLLFIKDLNNDRLTAGSKWGLLTLTKMTSDKIMTNYYVGTADMLPLHDEHDANSTNRGFIVTDVRKGDSHFRIINTHFTWSSEGMSTQLQHEHLDTLFKMLEDKNDFVLCGDFNAPRGRDTWRRLADKYTDNIPAEETTTLDPNLHKVKGLQYVVDGIFSTNEYSVNNVRVVGNLSDHKGLVGEITVKI